MLARTMGDGWFEGYSSSFINITLKLSVRNCQREPLLDLAQEIPEDKQVPENSEVADHVGSVLENALNWIFNWSFESVSENENNFDRKDIDHCESVLNILYETSFLPFSLLCASLIAFVTLSLLIFLLSNRKQYYKYHTKLVEDKSNKNTSYVEVNIATVPSQLEAAESVNSESKIQSVDTAKSNSEKSPQSNLAPLLVPAYTCSSDREVASIRVVPILDTTELLRHTADHFLSKVDQILGMTASLLPALPEPSAAASESLATPRTQKKGAQRRPKWLVPASRPLLAGEGSLAIRADMWQKVVDMGVKMGWRRHDPGELDVGAVQDSRLRAILQFHQQACPVPPEQWSAATLIVNYVLALVLNELSFAEGGGKEPFKILDFHSYGSAANGTCVGRANCFNLMLILQLTTSLDLLVTHSGVHEDIPAGKLLLSVNEQESVTRDAVQRLLLRDHTRESFGYYLSPREVTKATQTIVANAVERLKSKNAVAMERLPLKIYLAPYEELVLCIETKSLNGLGLGLPRISVHMTPAIRVTPLECDPLPALYAIPQMAWTRGNVSQARNSTLRSWVMRDRNQSIPADSLWQLSSVDVTSSFMSYADRKLRASDSYGCHVMCQQILRALLSHCGKDTILRNGELRPRVLDSIVCFLLLESHPKFWEISCLPDRLSDCILFLKAALQSEWMPDFALHNPHLQKQMPALKLLPLLASKRQENLFASLESDDFETILGFIDTRLQETGLNHCMKVEYSSEMWEYEFFIFG